jgi:HD-GYP domain-containing protein (c-di-GMP phosphodiesterase class II)
MKVSLNRRWKHLLTLFAAQVACIVIGLWMQHRFVTSSLSQTVANDEVVRLVAEAENFTMAAFGPDRTLPSLEMETLESVGGSLDSATPPRGVELSVVDQNGVVRYVSSPADSPEFAMKLGTSVEWSQPPQPSAEFGELRVGRFMVDGEEYLAAATTIVRGRLLVHRSMADIQQQVSLASTSTAIAGVLSAGWICVLTFMAMYLINTKWHDRAERELKETEAKSLQRIESLVRTRDAVIFGLAKLADSRDPETGDHLERIAIYSTTLASALRENPNYKQKISPSLVRLIGISSALHDIGKVGIADSILRKPGKLTDDERREMQTHSVIGGDCLTEIERRLGRSNFLEMAREIAMAHHERWDGSGYPNGLSREEIPLAARIVSIADVYDALASRRVYKPAMTHAKCVQIIREGAGTQFDPRMVEVWLKVADQFRDLAIRYTRPDSRAGASGFADPAAVPNDKPLSVVST